jgi:hypothetical protein
MMRATMSLPLPGCEVRMRSTRAPGYSWQCPGTAQVATSPAATARKYRFTRIASVTNAARAPGVFLQIAGIFMSSWSGEHTSFLFCSATAYVVHPVDRVPARAHPRSLRSLARRRVWVLQELISKTAYGQDEQDEQDKNTVKTILYILFILSDFGS